MKSQKGVTLTSLTMYVALIIIVIGILLVITASFQGNVKEIYAEGTANAEVDKFNVYFLKEVKKQGNEINTISENQILFSLGDKYTFNREDKCIYLNDNIKIAENIENCVFTSEEVNEKTVITVTIKAINTEEKTIEYVLSNESIVNISDNEADYTNYIPDSWDKSKLNSETPIYVEMIDNEVYLVPIPKGFEISGATTESTVENGLVIYEMTKEEKEAINWTDFEQVENAKQTYNQFVWIPVSNKFETTYSSGTDYLEPKELPRVSTSSGGNILDSQDNLDYYYEKNHYNYEEDFNYSLHYSQMVESVNKYDGFYIGRYETISDEEGKIGSKANNLVVLVNFIFKEGTVLNGEEYYYRWWRIYYLQRNSDVEGNGEHIQTNMIWGQQWDAMLKYLGTDKAESTISGKKSLIANSGIQTYDDGLKDLINNIYDLRRNVHEFTAEAYSDRYRVLRGR